MSGDRYGGMGWERDLPDFRDYGPDAPEVKRILDKSKPMKAAVKAAPAKVDLRQWCSPIEDQLSIGSCTAHAGVGLLEYFERRAFGRHLDGSRLFLYKTTRDLLGWVGDQGAYLRSTMKAMALFGVPPESYWVYDISKFDVEPSAFLYALGANYKAIKYFRLDPVGTAPAQVLDNIKTHLAAGLPCMFGFTVYSSMPGLGAGTGDIPFPKKGDKVEGGHAVDAVGYDDNHRIGSDRGALLIRNSWSTAWGEDGYGWLPYSYVLKGLAADFWTLVQADYIDTDLFK
ncbi:MAG: cysteine protease [Rhodospirillaceae bacterium]|nr:cysteine protease [Rhodospirillaceae bacterium]